MLRLFLLGVATFVLLYLGGVVGLGPMSASAGSDWSSVPTGQPDHALLDSIVSGVARKPVSASCSLRKGQRIGEAMVGGNSVRLSQRVCGALLYFQRDLTTYEQKCLTHGQGLCQGAVNAALVSMQALAHEAYHASGVEDESTTECYALQAVAYVASRLRDDPGLAQSGARYYAANYDELRAAPRTYRLTRHCRDGGKLDLRPETHWPG